MFRRIKERISLFTVKQPSLTILIAIFVLNVLFCKIFICVEDSETSRISQKLTPRSLEKSPGVNFLY